MKRLYHITASLLPALILAAFVSNKTYGGNPVFEGWYADPEGAVFGDRYWIYPTLSLLHGEDSVRYSADLGRTIDAVNQDYRIQTHMDAFSSPDLVNWTRHLEVLSIDSISWARFALWPPLSSRPTTDIISFSELMTYRTIIRPAV